MAAIAGGILGLLGIGAAGWWGLQRMGGAGGVPVIEADPRPFKIRPTDPGGLRVPNQSELILERPAQRSQTPAQAGRPAAIAPPAEAPNLEGLRAAVAPPPAPPPPPAAAPAASAPAPAPPAAAPAAPAGPAAMFGGRATVQLGALPSADAARAEWDRLARRLPELFEGRSPTILRLDRDGAPPMFRLRLTGLADNDAAGRFCEQVRARGGACVPVR
jgi:hypothetical protein